MAQSIAQFGQNEWKNIEDILRITIDHLDPSYSPLGVEKDELRYLVEKARLVSESDIQSIWARILAGEVNQPGMFSRRTMDILSHMGRRDAENFSKICQCCCLVGDEIYIEYFIL